MVIHAVIVSSADLLALNTVVLGDIAADTGGLNYAAANAQLARSQRPSQVRHQCWLHCGLV